MSIPGWYKFRRHPHFAPCFVFASSLTSLCAADLRAVRSGEWPNPRLATAARERASNSNQLRTDSPDLNDIRRSSLGGLVDAFFGDGPLSEPRGMSPIPNGDKWDLAAATFKTGDFSFQKEVRL